MKPEQKRMPDNVANELAEWIRRRNAGERISALPECQAWCIRNYEYVLDPEYADHYKEINSQT